MGELNGKVVVITGASSGIGRSGARLFAKGGARLVLVARSLERLETVRSELGEDVLLVPADVAEAGAASRIIDTAVERFGRVDALFANAGLFLEGPVADADDEELRRTLDVNVYATLSLVRATLPGMLAQGSGDIILTSSISGHHAIDSEPIYSASKHAVQAFTHALRQQIRGTGVRVAEIAPGMVLTDLWGFSEGDPRAAERLAASTGIRPEDVADAVRYMLTRPAHVTIRDLVILPSAQNI
ncbi:ribitol 2-dehydrogenase [Microbacterium sp. BE35]|uniref:SDR family oxidoreductase n=1 Tax=Microbacterium sp. BE35 TaxID=2817773 RepID=UPI00285FBA9B|nr:SDR family oxidoreductase [Microbacterium sp. BE35]MDR7188256.1 ribitol 2-dehydrogenase [Microbacterium sp. BE35]